MPAVIDVSIFNISTFDRLRAAPFGEDYIYEHSSSWITPYTFSGKEKDSETGYSYFGARYYDSDLSVWLSVDPMADKYPSMSSYMYTAGNPVMLVDPDGRALDDPPYTYQNANLVPFILEKFGYYSTVKQAGYLMGNTSNAIHIKNNLNVVATNFQVNIGRAIGKRENLEGSPQNAIRHTLWNALMTRLGIEQATRAANSHETGSGLNTSQRSFSYTKNNNSSYNKALIQADNVADLLNNEIGRTIGLANPNDDNKTIAAKVMKEYYTNGLYTTRTTNGKVEVVKTRITKEQYDAAIKEINKKGNNGLNE
jgi:RHS repeat-associated protein